MTTDLFEKVRKSERKICETTLKKLTEAMDKECLESMDVKHWNEIVDELADRGFGLAPNSLMLEEFPALTDPIFLYWPHENHGVDGGGNPYFHIALLNLAIVAYTYSTAGVDSEKFKKIFGNVEEFFNSRRMKLSESDLRGIKAHIEYFEIKAPTEKFIRKLKDGCTPRLLEICKYMVLGFTKWLDQSDPTEKSVRENIHKMFDLKSQSH